MPTTSTSGAISPTRHKHWQLPCGRLDLTGRVRLMGVLNVTPDSFSDGGQFVATTAAVEHALRLAAQGADLIDIGGESTRPGAEPVDERTELSRVMPVIERLVPQLSIPLSIDTSKATVAREAVAAGVAIVNDITALQGDANMLAVVLRSGAAVCLMHMQGTPRTMQQEPHYQDVVADVLAFLVARRDALTAGGIEPARIALDPGIGFGKTVAHNLALLANCGRLHELGCPVLVGHSRKSFLGKVVGDDGADRLAAGISTALWLAEVGVQVLRVHDVAAVRQAILTWKAIGALRQTSTAHEDSDVDWVDHLGDT